MTESDILLTVAELAVAFAGFASLVGILGQQRSTDSAPLNAARLRSMLESSLVALVFSLAPLLPPLFGSSEATSWRVVAVGFLATNVVRFWLFARRIPAALAAGANRWATLSVVAAQVAAILALLAVAVGIAGELAAAAYILALFTTLFVSAVFFLRLAVSLLGSQEPSA